MSERSRTMWLRSLRALLLCMPLLILSCTGRNPDAHTLSLSELKTLMSAANDSLTRYTLLGTPDDLSQPGVKMVAARISVPAGRALPELRTTLGRAALEIATAHRAAALMVFAYREGESTDATFTVGRATYGPNGRWEDAGSDAPIGFTIETGSLYFAEQGVERALVGSTINLVPFFGDSILIFTRATHWDPPHFSLWEPAEVVDAVPRGTRALVLDAVVEPISSNYLSVQYLVRAHFGNGSIEGMLHLGGVPARCLQNRNAFRSCYAEMHGEAGR